MSEINSIANGTFTIGQTSATNFVAGPGIKIDEPSAGTVRIGNDETVLFSASAGTSAATLSEPVENFQRIKIVHNKQIEEINRPAAYDTIRYWHFYGTPAQGTYKAAMVDGRMTDSTHFTNVSAKSLFFATTGTAAAFNVSLNDTYALNTIYSVIGINRINA